jgi:histone-lysine N-methyltransferase SETD3
LVNELFYKNLDDFDGTSIPPIDVETEMRVWQKVAKITDLALKKYPTTLIEDMKLLASDDHTPCLSSNARNCIMFRMGEKQILNSLSLASERFLHLLSLNSVAVRKEANSYTDFAHGEYFRQVIIPLI